MSESILQSIAARVVERLEIRRQRVSLNELLRQSRIARSPVDFAEIMAGSGPHVIAEIKFKSPALGELRPSHAADAVEIARSYLKGGAAVLSILTEQDYFNGSLDYLRAVRAEFPRAHLLMKDFVVDEYQILEGYLSGADAVLLILALLGPVRTKDLQAYARSLGLNVLVEVHDEIELEQAAIMKSALIGINNRNLKTLEVRLETSFRLAKLMPRGATLISESGIKTANEIKSLMQVGFKGFLIGSTLMAASDPGAALQSLIRGSCEMDGLNAT